MLRIRSTAAVAGLVPVLAATVLAVTVLAVTVLAVTGAAAPASAQQVAPGAISIHDQDWPAGYGGTSGFQIIVSSHFGAASDASGYSAIVVTGRRHGWFFGGTNPGGASTPIAERWDGTAIAAATLPPGLNSFVNEASAPSSADIWVASEYGGYVLHWNGAQWRLALRRSGGFITGLTAISATDVWVFGAVAGGRGTGTWHFNGRIWAPVTGRAGAIYRASALSRRDILAVAAGPKTDSVLRYDGRRWLPMHTGGVLAGVAVTDILAITQRDAWILGDETVRGATRIVLVHWNGARWTRIPVGVPAFAGHLSPGPDGTVLVTATPAEAAAAGLILQASAAGGHRVAAVRSGLGSGVSAVAMLPGTRLLLASGSVLTRLGGNAVIWAGRPARAADHRRHDPV